jgi:hypothetical protein
VVGFNSLFVMDWADDGQFLSPPRPIERCYPNNWQVLINSPLHPLSCVGFSMTSIHIALGSPIFTPTRTSPPSLRVLKKFTSNATDTESFTSLSIAVTSRAIRPEPNPLSQKKF